MNIITLCYAGFPGVNVVLHNASRVAGLSRHFVLTSVEPDAPELQFFAAFLRDARPDLVLFGAWTQGYQVLLQALHSDTTVAVYWSSSTGQVDMSNEAAHLGAILDEPRIHYRLFAQHTLAAALRRPDCLEMPLTFPVATGGRARRANATPIISLFCSPNEYRRKNILNSILAVGLQTHKYILYLNGLSGNPNYRRLLEILNVRYKDWGWMPDNKYRGVVSRVDVGLQVSFSESFDYVAADHVRRGIPVLVSRMVPVLHTLPSRVQKRLVVENPDDPLETAAKLKYLVTHPTARTSLGQSAQRHVLKTNEENIRKTKTLFTQIAQRAR